MKDNILETLKYHENCRHGIDDKEILAEAILSLFLEVVPKEMEDEFGGDATNIYFQKSKEGYNQAIKDIKE